MGSLEGFEITSRRCHGQTSWLRRLRAAQARTGNSNRFAQLGPRTLRVSARLILSPVAESPSVLISFDDITQMHAKAEALAAAKEEAERANLAKSRFLATVSHDLRQPLQTMTLVQGMLSETISDPAAKPLIERLERTVSGMSSLLDKFSTSTSWRLAS